MTTPSHPRPYVLWTLCAATAGFAIVNYITAAPTPDKERALFYQRLLASPDVFGWALLVLALVVAVAAAFERTASLARLAYASLIAMWAAGFAYSLMGQDAGRPAAGPLLLWGSYAAVAIASSWEARRR